MSTFTNSDDNVVVDTKKLDSFLNLLNDFDSYDSVKEMNNIQLLIKKYDIILVGNNDYELLIQYESLFEELNNLIKKHKNKIYEFERGIRIFPEIYVAEDYSEILLNKKKNINLLVDCSNRIIKRIGDKFVLSYQKILKTITNKRIEKFKILQNPKQQKIHVEATIEKQIQIDQNQKKELKQQENQENICHSDILTTSDEKYNTIEELLERQFDYYGEDEKQNNYFICCLTHNIQKNLTIQLSQITLQFITSQIRRITTNFEVVDDVSSKIINFFKKTKDDFTLICNFMFELTISQSLSREFDYLYMFYIGYFYSNLTKSFPDLKTFIQQITRSISPLLNSVYPKCEDLESLKIALKYLPTETEKEYINRINQYLIFYLCFMFNVENGINFTLDFFYNTMNLQINNKDKRFGMNECLLTHLIFTFFDICGEKAQKDQQFNDLMNIYENQYYPVLLNIWESKNETRMLLGELWEDDKEIKELLGHFWDSGNEIKEMLNKVRKVIVNWTQTKTLCSPETKEFNKLKRRHEIKKISKTQPIYTHGKKKERDNNQNKLKQIQ
ncbi:Glutamic acid-rich protein [Entamoeba marina]